MATEPHHLRVDDPDRGSRAVCYRCFKAAAVCVCPDITEVNNRTAVHILQHPREHRRAIGTVRFAELGLRRCHVEVVTRRAPVEGAGVALLFPGEGSRPLESLPSAERPTTLLVLDGTWSQAKALRLANPWLDQLPRVTFAEGAPSRYRIRAEPEANYLSTIESIVRALSVLEPETTGLDELLGAFEAMVETQLAYARRHRAPRARRRPRTVGWLDQVQRDAHRHVLVYVETTGPRGSLRPLQVCAQRVSTGERFECLIRPDSGWPATKLSHLGWGVGDELNAVTPAEFESRWAGYYHGDDGLIAWSQRSVDALGAARAILLKKLLAERNLSGRTSGDPSVNLDRLGLPWRPAPFAGRAADHMGQTLALLAYLLEGHGVPGSAEAPAPYSSGART